MCEITKYSGSESQMRTTMSSALHICTLRRVYFIPIFLIVFSSVTSQYVPHLPPFFFLCNYHGKPQQSHLDSGEVAISVAIAGNPENYKPESLYEITISSTRDFDGFMLTGLYTIKSDLHTQLSLLPRSNAVPSMSIGSTEPLGEQFVCSVVHSYISHRRRQQLMFLWRAPKKDTGCVSFLATATLGDQVLFKDTTIMQLCEEGAGGAVRPRPRLAMMHGEGIVFRDDFDSTENTFNDTLWKTYSGVEISEKCGVVLYGNPAVACGVDTARTLVTQPMNMTTAAVLQFSVSSGTCTANPKEELTVYYGTKSCTAWTPIEQVRLASNGVVSTVVVHLPDKARRRDICLKWGQPDKTTNYTGCWALDNVLVNDMEDRPISLQDNFDPVDPGNWLFFPGARILHKCHSDTNAMVFVNSDQENNYVTTRDLNLEVKDVHPILEETFDGKEEEGWDVTGGQLGNNCGLLDKDVSMVMSDKDKVRLLCTPSINLKDAGNLRFHFTAGSDRCFTKDSSKKADVFVYVEDDLGHTVSLLNLTTQTSDMGVKQVSLPIPPRARKGWSRVCWAQKSHGGENNDVWAVDSVLVLPPVPPEPQHYLQFALTMHCGPQGVDNSVNLEFSPDLGLNWFPLHERCLPGSCHGSLQTLSSFYQGKKSTEWEQYTIPVATAALTKHTRFRWRQIDAALGGNWAIDSVYIGPCTDGCNGHGICTETGCVCNFDFEGPSCGRVKGRFPSMLIDDMFTISSIRANFAVVKGATLSYLCGVVGSGKAVVFHQGGRREMQTMDLNTTATRYLQFSVRVGSESETGDCAMADQEDELVLLQYSCSGNVKWKTLRLLTPIDFSEPQMVSVHLPDEARNPACRFRWWQPVHSGFGHDVWAVDDVSLTGHMYNTINLDFTDVDQTEVALDVHLGKTDTYCGLEHTLSFSTPYVSSELRYIVTDPMHIGPSFVIQFDLVMGCGKPFAPNMKNQLELEFSVDHGMSWKLVRAGCWPPRICSEYHTASVFYAVEYSAWKRVSIALPQATWSSTTKFQWRQSEWSDSDHWAVTNLYIGQSCPQMCSGHGRCVEGLCTCDSGYGGITCSPDTQLPNTLKTDFSMMHKLESDWSAVLGADVAGANQGCGVLLSGESLYFSKAGPRQLISKDLHTLSIDFLQFYIRVGGGGNLRCYGIERREENILVQYSNDGGVTWHLLKELQETEKPRFVHVSLPEKVKTESTRFRWWQPTHSGENVDQWAVDGIILSKYKGMANLLDTFQQDSPSVGGDIWLTVTEGMYAPYCQSPGDTLMFADQRNEKFAMTKDMELKKGDIIQFRLNVGCSKAFSFHHPVLLQYSHDAGLTWKLVNAPCYIDDQCSGRYSEGSIYYTGTYGEWRLVVIPLDDKIVNGRVNFRWWQQGGPVYNFALDDVYIGPPCLDMCSGHGVCLQGACSCDRGYTGERCLTSTRERHGMIDRFDNMNHPSEMWERILGGALGTGCGVLGGGNSMYFSGSGTREARTVALETTKIRIVQFLIKIGSSEDWRTCHKPTGRNEGVIVDFTTDNGITWHILRILDPETLSDEPQTVTLELPPSAKKPSTVIRWWQPIISPGSPRAEWAIDDVIIAVNDTNSERFQENFNPMNSNVWYMAMNAVPKITCSSLGNALEFSKNAGRMRYAETWDFRVTPSTFLQFDIAMGCSGTYSALYSVQLQFSVDMGHSWSMVADDCLPPQLDCSGYHLSSSFLSDAYANWTRVTRYLPSTAVSPATRFRWLQKTVTLRGNIWALDNIYLGDGCPWMCSGHGQCDQGVCRCDPGYFGVYCVAYIPLPMVLKETFETRPSRDKWPEVYGGEISNVCGILVSGTALTFFKDNLRKVVTRDLDVSMSHFIQFTFQYGCSLPPSSQSSPWPREYTVLLQYSNNGGILWHLLKEIHFQSRAVAKFFSVRIATPAQTNSTRFRFWQPRHGGHMTSVWAVDNFFADGAMTNPEMVYETFDAEPDSTFWIFWPGGKIAKFCSFNTRSDTILAGSSSMLFVRGKGEHSITTRDLSVSDITVVQFDINVGCTPQSTDKFPVRLEYSQDHGKTWRLVVPPCSLDRLPMCSDREIDTTVYYAGRTEYWRRIVVPLNGLQICGVARFRWYQGFFSTQDVPPEWAVDNVYIGMQCMGHCGGHGTCINGMLCQCDEGYNSDRCVAIRHHPTFLKEDFELTSQKTLDRKKWTIVSGSVQTKKCGELMNNYSLHFVANGDRLLVTRDLDLSVSRIIQFFIQLGCTKTQTGDLVTEPVLLQYSTNGGISWKTVEQFSFSEHTVTPKYIALHMPPKARTNSTRIRWWQPSVDGTFQQEWAIDQVYIGGDINGRITLQDDTDAVNTDNFVMHPGATLQPVCGAHNTALHFSGENPVRYAVTADVTITEATYIQFYLSMGCSYKDRCFGIVLEYSIDFGHTWNTLQKECMPSDVTCSGYHGSSSFKSDVYDDWNRVTMVLPHYTRSKTTRFRWVQPERFNKDDTWALRWIYIGDECDCSCAGHGRCDHGTCKCDKGWGGRACSEPLEPLPTLLSDCFSQSPKQSLWATVNGAEVSKNCGVLSAGTALHFTGGCTRQLITTDLDLRDAIFIQFTFKFGCVSAPSHRDEGIIIDYSTSGGTEWTKIVELFYDHYRNATFKIVALPADAKKDGVRIRWWQPHHDGSNGDWAIDTVLIAGKVANPAEMRDGFDSQIRRYMWFEDNNARLGPFCGSTFTISGKAETDEDVTLTTADMHVKRGYVLQFSISVGCDATPDADIVPVHLQYSVDFGMSWRYVVEECLSTYPQCNGEMTVPSVYFSSNRWRRETLLLKGAVETSSTRFRWHQTLKQMGATTRKLSWALDDVYIGTACPDLCHGHGQCDYPLCICDQGYGGHNCHQLTPIKTYLKDTFEPGSSAGDQWSMIQGGGIGIGCRTLVEGQGLHFSGHGQRQAVTIDLDLRNARFVQYTAMIGGSSTKKECGTPRSRNESIILQYSTDAGITWHTLHVLDYSAYYTTPQHDYLHLPRDARTNSTRVRWWQALESDARHHVGWTLDDVYIGGSKINPSELYENFDGKLDAEKWESSPGCEVRSTVCQRGNAALYWDGEAGDVRGVTTRQLIVQSGHMLQFKIMVGCGLDPFRCTTDRAVELQYNKDPLKNNWELVFPRCTLNGHGAHTECRPYQVRQGTVYTANGHPHWARVSLMLPLKVFSSTTRFRWVQQDPSNTELPDWAIDDVYIGEACPLQCHGRGDCVHGKCVCDPTYVGETCESVRSQLLSHMTDGFEDDISPRRWQHVSGGSVGLGCGALLPLAHGKNLYFNGCGLRHAITAELDLTRASKVMFVLKIGSVTPTDSCNIDLNGGSFQGMVLLQYSKNKGIDWHLLATHDPHEFLSPHRVGYDIPREARTFGIQFRWWQPEHRGEGKDQWAIDIVEIVMTRQDQMLRTENYYRSYRRRGFIPSHRLP